MRQFIPLLLLMISFASCYKGCCEDNCEDYVFHFPWEVSGVDEFARLGHTITFTSHFYRDVKDQTYGAGKIVYLAIIT